MIKAYRYEPVLLQLCCDKCGTEMERRPSAFLADAIQFEYKCPKCSETIVTTKDYPIYIGINLQELENFVIRE